jgi:hypothetical protein
LDLPKTSCFYFALTQNKLAHKIHIQKIVFDFLSVSYGVYIYVYPVPVEFSPLEMPLYGLSLRYVKNVLFHFEYVSLEFQVQKSPARECYSYRLVAESCFGR